MEKSFEQSLTDLEEIVTKLEAGDLPLEQSLKLFEEGIRLSRTCRDRITQAERRIEILMKETNDGSLGAKEIEFSEE
ncbi:MAG: exodeoxyribonuclease VII small subunit [Acidobacteria bacterium]|nr:exodeoxyribonuclease VII small subunit [Acidobacteriota bacterium]